MESFQSLVTIAPWTFIFTICNLLILTAIVKKLLFKPVQQVLAKRQAELDGIYDTAHKAQADAETMRGQYETRLRGAEREAGEIVKNATTAAQRRGDEIVNDAKDTAEALRRRTDDELRREKRKAEIELKDEVSGIALDIAQRVVEKEIDPARHEAMIEEFLSGLGDAS